MTKEIRVSLAEEDASDLPGIVFDPDTLTFYRVNPDGSRAQFANGGSQPLINVRLPIAFDTPGLNLVALPITAVNQGTKTLTVAGDQTANVPAAGLTISVSGSTGNDGLYTVVSATFAAGSTAIVVVEALPDATVDGDVNTGVGIPLGYTPAIGDVFTIGYSIPGTAWDGGSQPEALVWAEGGDPLQAQQLVKFDLQQGQSGAGFGFSSTGAPLGAAGSRATLAVPLRIMVFRAEASPPVPTGATVGDTEIVLCFLPTA